MNEVGRNTDAEPVLLNSVRPHGMQCHRFEVFQRLLKTLDIQCTDIAI